MTSYPAPAGYAPSYSWIGAPTSFNGTNPLTGGDSCKKCPNDKQLPIYPLTIFSRGESESMVRPRRPSIYHCSFGYGRGHDTRAGISVLWFGTAKVCLDNDMGLHGFVLRHYLSMVPVGLFTRILGTRNERLHRRSQSFRFDQHPWCPQSRLAVNSRIAV